MTEILSYKTLVRCYVGRSARRCSEQMRKWWMCAKGKYYQEYVALQTTEISGGAGPTGDSAICIRGQAFSGS